jgi:hypothetical protein
MLHATLNAKSEMLNVKYFSGYSGNSAKQSGRRGSRVCSIGVADVHQVTIRITAFSSRFSIRGSDESGLGIIHLCKNVTAPRCSSEIRTRKRKQSFWIGEI